MTETERSIRPFLHYGKIKVIFLHTFLWSLFLKQELWSKSTDLLQKVQINRPHVVSVRGNLAGDDDDSDLQCKLTAYTFHLGSHINLPRKQEWQS